MKTIANPLHQLSSASHWVRRWSHLVPEGGTVLDVACGQGRHMQWFAGRGHAVTGVDRSAEALSSASRWGQTVLADIETAPWPLLAGGEPTRFDAVVATNYLWRALMPVLLQSVAPGGVLIHETFAHGNASVGKPTNPDFLLQPGELLALCHGMQIVAFEDGFLDAPERFVQRIVAIQRSPGTARSVAPPQYRLSAPDASPDAPIAE